MTRGRTRCRRLDSLARRTPLVICLLVSMGDERIFGGIVVWVGGGQVPCSSVAVAVVVVDSSVAGKSSLVADSECGGAMVMAMALDIVA